MKTVKTQRKFNLNYRIEVEDINGDIHTFSSIENNYEIMNSIAIKVDIKKDNTTSANSCNIELYNLGTTTRKLLKKSRLDTNINRIVRVYAGYQYDLVLIYTGTIEVASSEKQGANFITKIQVRDDFAMLNSTTQQTITKDYSKNPLILLANDLKQTKIGVISKNITPINISSRGRVFNGKTWDLLRTNIKLAEIYIDNMQLYIMKQNEVLNDYELVISNESGMIGEPKEYDGYLEMSLIFEPLASLNHLVKVDSEIAPEYNGEYKVIGIQHQFSIAKIGSQAGQSTTTIKVQYIKNMELV